MNKLLVITGPTATGKTDLGLLLAEKFNGEIISADSRQVYKHMDIGTGKDTTHFQWGLDLVEPDVQFNVSDYVNYADGVIKEILSRGKLPIIVGGTGQYIKELLFPSETLHLPPNEELRNKLSGYSVTKLQEELRKTNPNKWESMNKSDRSNPRRLVRAIEVAGQKQEVGKPKFDALFVGLTAPLEVLYKRIDQRVEERIANGMAEERKKLEKMGYRPNAFGYTEDDTSQWKFHEHGYARRQLTYMRHQLPQINWFDITDGGYQQEIVARVARWYSGGSGNQESQTGLR